MRIDALQWLAVWPEIILLVMACVVLIGDLFVREAQRAQIYWLTIAAIAITAICLMWTHSDKPVIAFNGMFVDDSMADVLKVMACIATAAMLIYSRDYLRTRGLFRGEFFVLSLFALLGMLVMISAAHFLTLYLGLELLALSQYSMVALQRDSRQATEAAMKYFVLGALASGLLLYGLSMLYGATGSLHINEVAQIISDGKAGKSVLVFATVFIVCGLAFKLGVVPFHMWIPDVYHGAPTPITLFIGSAPKLAAFGFVLRILAGALQSLLTDWQGMLVILAVLSMALGNIAAIAQTNFKRMLAYSTISHMGFLLIGVLSGSQNGYSSAMFYTIIYALMSVGAFGIILLLAREGFEAENLADLRGLNRRDPWLAVLALLLMFSLAGVPPTVGFYAKFAVLQAAWEAGLSWLVVVAVVLSVVGAFYYLRVVRLMYFEEPPEGSAAPARFDARVLMSINGLAVIALGILPQPLMALCARAISQSLPL